MMAGTRNPRHSASSLLLKIPAVDHASLQQRQACCERATCRQLLSSPALDELTRVCSLPLTIPALDQAEEKKAPVDPAVLDGKGVKWQHDLYADDDRPRRTLQQRLRGPSDGFRL